MNNHKYKNILRKMLIMECMGESIYNSLASKAINEESASVYKKLSENEAKTANYIINEMKRLGFSIPKTRKLIIKFLSRNIFSVLSHKKLETLLKKTLKKRMFNTWFNLYHKNNQDFWQSMLDHEKLQYELLEI